MITEIKEEEEKEEDVFFDASEELVRLTSFHKSQP